MLFLILSYLAILTVCRCDVIKIAGLYPNDGDWTAPQIKSIGEFTKVLINNATNILPNHQLTVDWKNSQCRRKSSLDKLLEFIQTKDSIYHFVLGPACSISAEPVGDIIPNYYLNMIAYSATSPGLASSTYPNTFLGITTSNNFVVVWVKIVQFYNWRRLAILNQDTGIFNTISLNFEDELKVLNVTFDNERLVNGKDLSEIDNKLDRIFSVKKYKVIFANFYEGVAYNVLCRAYFKGYIYPHVTWILPAWYTKSWIENGKKNCMFCQGCDIEAALKGSIGVDSISTLDQTIIHNRDTVLGLKQQQIWSMFTENNMVLDGAVEKYLPYVVDSLLSIAIALNTSLQNDVDLNQFNYHEQSNATINSEIQQSLLSSLAQVDFAGLTGEVNYERKARGFSSGELFEYQSEGVFASRLVIPNIARNISKSISELNVPFDNVSFMFFAKEAGPLDGVELHHLPTSALIIAVIFTICALMFSIFFLGVNIVFQKRKVIRYSSPILNAVILIGACLQCGVAILVLIDNRLLDRTPEDQLNNVPCVVCTTLCHLVWWLPALATDLIFGTLIGKAVRIYSIAIRRSLHSKVKLIYIFLAISALMLLDTLYSVIWAGIEVLRFQFIAVGPLETEYVDITQPGSPFWYIFYCAEGGNPNSAAIAVRFVYILFRWVLYGIGMYFAFQIRKIRIRGVNEFQSITLATFATIFFNLVRIILITMIPSVRLIDAAITLLSISYALDTILVVSFLFVPKLYFIIKDPNEKKRYTGVNNTSEIDVSTIHNIQMSKVKEELDKVKSERDNLNLTVRRMSVSKIPKDDLMTRKILESTETETNINDDPFETVPENLNEISLPNQEDTKVNS